MAVRSPSKRKVAGSIPAEALIFFLCYWGWQFTGRYVRVWYNILWRIMKELGEKPRIIKCEPKATYSQWKDSFLWRINFVSFLLFCFFFFHSLIYWFISFFIYLFLSLFVYLLGLKHIAQWSKEQTLLDVQRSHTIEKVLRYDLQIYLFINRSHNK